MIRSKTSGGSFYTRPDGRPSVEIKASLCGRVLRIDDQLKDYQV